MVIGFDIAIRQPTPGMSPSASHTSPPALRAKSLTPACSSTRAASRAAQIPQVHALNARLEAWAKTQDWARYIDTTSYLADEQGRPRAEFYRKDRLHLNDEGYRRWKSILEPVLREEWAKASAENP